MVLSQSIIPLFMNPHTTPDVDSTVGRLLDVILWEEFDVCFHAFFHQWNSNSNSYVSHNAILFQQFGKFVFDGLILKFSLFP